MRTRCKNPGKARAAATQLKYIRRLVEGWTGKNHSCRNSANAPFPKFLEVKKCEILPRFWIPVANDAGWFRNGAALSNLQFEYELPNYSFRAIPEVRKNLSWWHCPHAATLPEKFFMRYEFLFIATCASDLTFLSPLISQI